MITANQLLCHFIGDYLLQSHWMATEKTKRSAAALVHVLIYGLAFLFLRPSWTALFVIVSTHFVIDRWRLARYVVWAKNWIGPFWLRTERVVTPNPTIPWGGTQLWQLPSVKLNVASINLPWGMSSATGFSPETPIWLATWLLIITDNIMHVVINGLALRYL